MPWNSRPQPPHFRIFSAFSLTLLARDEPLLAAQIEDGRLPWRFLGGKGGQVQLRQSGRNSRTCQGTFQKGTTMHDRAPRKQVFRRDKRNNHPRKIGRRTRSVSGGGRRSDARRTVSLGGRPKSLLQHENDSSSNANAPNPHLFSLRIAFSAVEAAPRGYCRTIAVVGACEERHAPGTGFIGDGGQLLAVNGARGSGRPSTSGADDARRPDRNSRSVPLPATCIASSVANGRRG